MRGSHSPSLSVYFWYILSIVSLCQKFERASDLSTLDMCVHLSLCFSCVVEMTLMYRMLNQVSWVRVCGARVLLIYRRGMCQSSAVHLVRSVAANLVGAYLN